MNCPACTASVADDAVFCPQCGARLRSANPTVSSADQATTADTRAEPVAEPKPEAGLRAPRRDAPEEELWTGSYSPKAMYGVWIGAAFATVVGLVVVAIWRSDTIGWSVFLVAALLLWGGLLLSLAYRRMAVKYRLTSQRLIHERGVLQRVTDRIETIDIDDVTYVQGLFERFVGVGTIRVTSSDRTTPEFVMPGIDNVKEVADTIDRARRAERQRRGLYIESV